VNSAVIHLLFVGVPLAVVAILAALIFSRKGNHPATYKLSQPWTHEPILWAAVDEVIPGGGHHGHGSDEVSVGGGASGKW
jgi:zinc transporter ZupT